MAYSTIIGDSQPAATVCPNAALPISITTYAKLANANDPVNDSKVSGKKLGAMFQYEVTTGLMEVVVATGSDTTSPWTRLTSKGVASSLALSTAAQLDTAAKIATQLNLIEVAVNKITAGSKITPA